MTRSGLISDDFWAVVEPLLPVAGVRRGRPWADHRTVLEGICWRYRTGSPWRDLPPEFGPWQTVWKRHFRWSKDGTYRQMLGLVAGVPAVADDQVGMLGMMLSADSTIVRAHQHAAGARKLSGDPEATSTVPPDTGGTVE
jgi:transposase